MAKKTTEKDNFKENIVKAVTEDFLKRREERASFDHQWKLNLNYVAGNQYCEISPRGEIVEQEKYYGWQSRSVFNHISPIIDTRLAKLSRVRPAMSVRASSGEDGDLKTAIVATDLLTSTSHRIGLDKIISTATEWSEVLGTAFYKVLWNEKSGKLLGETEGEKVFEGDVSVTAISPFEIFPDSLFAGDLSKVQSLIHARAVPVYEINEKYGVNVEGEEIDAFTLNKEQVTKNGGYKAKKTSTVLKDHVILIERYERPSKDYPNGRYIAVAGNELLAYGELPYENGVDGRRDFPFVRQISTAQVGCFFGVSLVERLIPLQRAYNAVKNRKYEFLNRVSMGVINVEDGSIDTDELIDDGLSPGKVIVYRQGSRPPQMMPSGSVPLDFTYEEERLTNEFVSISGISEVSRSSSVSESSMSGVALELLIEQDETRLSVTAEAIRSAVKEIAKQIIRLFKQFAVSTRIMRSVGEGKDVKLFYFNASDLSSDDIVFDTENELTQTPAQKKTAVLEMLSSGLLADENGKLSSRTKLKVLEILGYGSLANAGDINSLHVGKAEKENIELEHADLEVGELDDHALHVEEHLRKLLSMDNEKLGENEYKKRIKAHVQKHNELILKSALANV
ncbi:MAG: hypothetical protein IJA97_01395 [Clostridia bacterium]|nr:hypothetical protein [Clostridia bacterium]